MYQPHVLTYAPVQLGVSLAVDTGFNPPSSGAAVTAAAGAVPDVAEFGKIASFLRWLP